MRSVIVVHPDFDACWPLAANHFHTLWRAQGEVEFLRVAAFEQRPLAHLLTDPASVTRLIALSISVTAPDLNAMKQLRELATDGACPPDLQATVQQLGMRWV